MTIYVDVSAAVHAKAGLSRYSCSLVGALTPLLGERLRLFQNSLGRSGPLAGWQGAPAVGVRWGYRPWRSLVWAQQALHWPVDALLPGAELFHATEHLLPHLRRIPTVLTVHDLIFERLPQYHKPLNHFYLHSTMPLYCQRASAIIAVSEATRADLQRLYGVDGGKITVIPEAAADHLAPPTPPQVAAARARYGLPARYVVSVGTLEPRKNLTRLVDACGPLLAEGLLEALVLVGSKGWLYEGFFAHLAEVPWRDKVILPGFVADEDLAAVYGGALAAAQPSLYEGFGLPVLEAMACGCPVCASATTSLPEVGGAAARYFDPEEVEAITAALRAVLHDAELRAEMRDRGLQRAAQYSWRHTAAQTLALYERVLGR
jgi:glycosyltransferase involved in cell wall biosynthesis